MSVTQVYAFDTSHHIWDLSSHGSQSKNLRAIDLDIEVGTLRHPATCGLNHYSCLFSPQQSKWDFSKSKSDHVAHWLRSLQCLLHLPQGHLRPLDIHIPSVTSFLFLKHIRWVLASGIACSEIFSLLRIIFSQLCLISCILQMLLSCLLQWGLP